MAKTVFDKLNFTHLPSTQMMLQLTDSMVRYPIGIAKDIPVKIQGYFVPVDFMVLDMETTKESPLIIGRKDENSRKRSKTDLRYRKTKAVGSGYFYI
jgi:hypothetical protein